MASRPITIVGEAPRALSAVQEAKVLRSALRGGAAPAGIRQRLALLLNQLDSFDETIALLDAVPEAEMAGTERLLLAVALLGRGEDRDAARALAAAEAAHALATSAGARAQALVAQARALARLGRRGAARARLVEAVALDPGNAAAWTRLAADCVSPDAAEEMLALTRDSPHAGAMATRAVALAATGSSDASRDLLGLDEFLFEGSIDPPEGWDDLQSFNAALARELLASPAIRDGRHGTASVDTRRIDSLVAGSGPLARLLVDAIIAAAQRRAGDLGDIDHPWIAAAPCDAVLRSWCVITGPSGFERWHMHPSGWMSGVYYVQVPDAVVGGIDPSGCLMLGLPEERIGDDAAARAGRRTVRPRAGLLALFPSHSFHRTFPHEAEGTRICVAFDIGAGGHERDDRSE